MDREDVRQSLQVILDVTQEVKNGRNYLIFPEGTRSRRGNQVGDFKGGSFKCAVKAKAPIVPVALLNAFEPFDRNSIAPGDRPGAFSGANSLRGLSEYEDDGDRQNRKNAD